MRVSSARFRALRKKGFGQSMSSKKSLRWPVLFAVLALVLAGGVFAGCGGDDDESSDSGTTASSGDVGAITVGSDIPYPPFEQGNPPDYEGFDIDVMNDIADRIGADVTYQDTSFDTIFTDLANGKFDAVISASTITADRQKTVDFSDPYYEANQALVVAEGSDIKTTADLSGKTVAAQDGTTGEDYANNETDAGTVNGFPQGPEVIAAVKNGQADAGILDEPVAQDALQKEGGFVIAETISTNELYGIAFPKDDDELQDNVNSALQEMKDDGTLQQLYEKWFPGLQVPDSVLNGTTTNP